MIIKRHMKNFFFIIYDCFSIYDQNIHCLATEIHKVANDLLVGGFKNVFDFKDKYTLHISLINTEKVENFIRYFGAVIWITATSLNGTEERIKSWKPECLCQLCKTFLLQGVSSFSFGFKQYFTYFTTLYYIYYFTYSTIFLF